MTPIFDAAARARLGELARAATPGERLTIMRYDHGGGRVAIMEGTERDLVADYYDEANREYYCAADPATVTALLAALDAAEAELDAARKSTYSAAHETYYKATEQALSERGYKMHELQWKWRTSLPDKFDYYECELAVLDALNSEGCAAWNGDASGCVTQIVEAQAKRAAAAEADAAQARAALAQQFLTNAAHCDDGAKGCANIDTLQDEVIRWEAMAETWREAAAALSAAPPEPEPAAGGG